MMKTICLSIALLAFVSFFRTGDATVSFTNPSGGEGTFTVAENNAIGAAVDTVTATGASTVGTFTLVTTGTPFTIDGTSGALTVTAANTLDYETTNSYVLTITAADTDGTETATVTVEVTDVNDLAPEFSDSVVTSNCFTSPLASGTTVYTASATDPDAGSAITYAKGSGISNAALDLTDADVITQSQISTSQLIEIEADDGVNTGTQTLVIRVESDCSTAAAVAVSVLTILGSLLISLS